MILGGVGFGGMDGAPGMMGRRINGGQLQRTGARIEDVVPKAGRYENATAWGQIPAHAQIFRPVSQADQSPSLLHTDELVGVRVSFQSHFALRGNVHQGHLQRVTCRRQFI